MKPSIPISAVAAAAACALIFAWQARQIDRLEARASTLRAASTDTPPDQPSQETTDARPTRPASDTSTRTAQDSEKRLDRIAETLTRRIVELGDTDGNIGGLLRLLPALLPHVESLEIDELIAVADRLGSGGLFPPTDDLSAARLVLYILAAEQEPLKVLSRDDLEFGPEDEGLQLSIFNTLARQDPAAAIRWLDAQSMEDGDKSDFQSGIALGLLAHDPRRGLDYILENPSVFPGSGMGPLIAGLRLPAAARDGLIEALPDPRYAKLRPTLSKMILESSLATARVAELREQSAALQLGGEQITHFIRDHSSHLMQRDPDAAAAWMKDALPADQYPSMVSTAIRHWTERDFNAAATFLGTMERGPARDQSIREFADVVASMEPESAAKWAAEIEDPTLRQSALREVGRSWLHLDPGAARAWMEKQGIPAPDATHPETESP
jgi:hypothetical protein